MKLKDRIGKAGKPGLKVCVKRENKKGQMFVFLLEREKGWEAMGWYVYWGNNNRKRRKKQLMENGKEEKKEKKNNHQMK